jgi:hypothetical protein
MKSWVDTVASYNNNLLVLVFHGVDGIGYEALPHELLDEYFQYIKQNEDDIWVATFGDATKYMRERMGSTVKVAENKNGITVMLNHNLDQRMYNLPLTLKSYVSPDWKNANIKQGTKSVHAVVENDNLGSFVQYQAIPNLAPIEISNNQ